MDEEKSQQNSLLFHPDNITPEEVTQIQWVQDKQTTIFDKTADQWKISKPFKDQADTRKLNKFLKDLFNERAQIMETPQTLDEYDLNRPSLILILKMESGSKTQLKVSNQPTFDGHYFLKKDSDFYLASSQWKQHIRMTVNDYRSRKLNHTNKRPKKFSIYKQGRKQATFVLRNKQWEKKPSSPYPLSHKKIRQFLRNFKQNQSLTFTSKKASSVLSQKVWKRATFEIREPQTGWWLKIRSLPNNKGEVVVKDRNFVYKIDEKFTKELLDTDFTDYRSPFVWDVTRLHEIEIKANDLDILIRKNPALKRQSLDHSSQWQVIHPSSSIIQRKGFDPFLDWISKLQATGYYPSRKNLKYPDFIHLKDQEGRTLLKLDLTSILFDKYKKKQIYLKSNQSNHLLSIDHSEYQKATPSSIIQKSP